MKVVKALEQKYRNHLTSEIGKIANPSGKYTDEQYKKLLKLHDLRRAYDMKICDLMKSPSELKSYLKQMEQII